MGEPNWVPQLLTLRSAPLRPAQVKAAAAQVHAQQWKLLKTTFGKRILLLTDPLQGAQEKLNRAEKFRRKGGPFPPFPPGSVDATKSKTSNYSIFFSLRHSF